MSDNDVNTHLLSKTLGINWLTLDERGRISTENMLLG